MCFAEKNLAKNEKKREMRGREQDREKEKDKNKCFQRGKSFLEKRKEGFNNKILLYRLNNIILRLVNYPNNIILGFNNII